MLDVSLWTELDLLELIRNEVQEDIQLDYKASPALSNIESKKTEISKDVSAMANSAGNKWGQSTIFAYVVLTKFQMVDYA